MRTGIEIVKMLDNFLKSKNLSRRQFCALVDIPSSTVATWKQKDIMPSIEHLNKVAIFMNVSLDYLINNNEFIDYPELSIKYGKELLQLNSLSTDNFKIITDLLNKLSKIN